MNRYDDNTSPQPTAPLLENNFKTPELSNNASLFPTPPSDSEESRDSIYNKYQTDYHLKANQTPIIDGYFNG